MLIVGTNVADDVAEVCPDWLPEGYIKVPRWCKWH